MRQDVGYGIQKFRRVFEAGSLPEPSTANFLSERFFVTAQILLTRTAPRSMPVSQVPPRTAATAYRPNTAAPQPPRPTPGVSQCPQPHAPLDQCGRSRAPTPRWTRLRLPGPRDFLGALYAVVSFFLEEGIHAWVLVTGITALIVARAVQHMHRMGQKVRNRIQ